MGMIEQKVIETAKEVLKDNNRAQVYFVYTDGTKEKRRIFKSNYGRIAVFNKGSKKWGNPLTSYSTVVEIIPIQKREINEKDRWEQKLRQMQTRLENSGLWENILRNVIIALDIGYSKIKKAYDVYWEIKDDNLKLNAIKEIDERLVYVTDEGKECVNTDIVWYFSHIPKIKKMYFGKYQNEMKLREISDALDIGKEINVSATAGYDVSFSYNPKFNKAWYSEEYRNCGNGHYYLALDKTHAWFYEDD